VAARNKTKKATPQKKAPHHVWRKLFLAALASRGNITEAARDAGVHRSTISHIRRDEPVFNTACLDALEEYADWLEKQARAKVERKDPDTTMVIFLLKAARPEKYRDRHEITGKDGGPLRITHIETILPPDATATGDPEA
jgi:hypothetical protein